MPAIVCAQYNTKLVSGQVLWSFDKSADLWYYPTPLLGERRGWWRPMAGNLSVRRLSGSANTWHRQKTCVIISLAA